MLNGAPMAPTPANIKYAHRLAIEIRDRIRHGTFSMAEYFPASGTGGTLTVGSQLDTWLAAQRVASSTKAGYTSAARFWKAASFHDSDMTLALGDQPLRALKHSHVLTALARRPDLKGKTVNNYVSVIREALALAVTDRLLPSNPVDGVPRAKSQKDPPDPFSRDEAEAIIADMLKHYPEQVGNMVECWFFTGPRTSEVFGQRWPNVDLRSGRLAVVEAVVRGETKGTKTNTAREVILNSRALAALHRQAKYTRLAGEHVWQDPRYGTPWVEERAFRRSYWTPTLKRLGIRYRRPYNMRHTYATMLLMAGLRPAFCAKQLGHSVEIFLRTYSKWLDGPQNDREMAQLEAALLSPDSPQESKTPG
jgi:integrase